MTTPLEKSLKRELTLDGVAYTLVISPEGLHLAPKGKRRGVELRWADLVSGESALAVALNASLQNVGAFPARAAEDGATRSASTPAGGRVVPVSTPSNSPGKHREPGDRSALAESPRSGATSSRAARKRPVRRIRR